MVEIKINDKTLNITADKAENKLLIDGKPVSEELLNEFQEEILHKKISEATDEEIEERIQYMAKELHQWLIEWSVSWVQWKKWAKSL